MEVAPNDLKDLVLEAARYREERDALRARLAEVERERDEVERERNEARKMTDSVMVLNKEQHERAMGAIAERNDALLDAQAWCQRAQRAAEHLAEVERERVALQRHYDAAAPEHNLLALLDGYHAEIAKVRAEGEAVCRERDDARRVAKRLARTGQQGCATDADRDAFDAAVLTALAYEVEP